MISFRISQNNENVIEVWCDTGLPIEKSVLIFTRNEGYAYVAKLVCMRLEKQMKDRLEIIRAIAYQEGYRDGKNHRKMKEYFNREW